MAPADTTAAYLSASADGGSPCGSQRRFSPNLPTPQARELMYSIGQAFAVEADWTPGSDPLADHAAVPSAPLTAEPERTRFSGVHYLPSGANH